MGYNEFKKQQLTCFKEALDESAPTSNRSGEAFLVLIWMAMVVLAGLAVVGLVVFAIISGFFG